MRTSHTHICRPGQQSHSAVQADMEYTNTLSPNFTAVVKWLPFKKLLRMLLWRKCTKLKCLHIAIHFNISSLLTFPPTPCRLLPLALSPLPSLLSASVSASSPASLLQQPLSFSAAGVGEGEGKPGGADGALFQGAAGTRRLRQHQERRHARPNVRQTHLCFLFLFLKICFLFGV